ncbi:MAG: YicC family protein [Proteobacteria bacterium]|nr:YicC family protein [Pseudomonadota bacterium]
MSLKSMTGFARTSGSSTGYEWAWEIKSVNGKGFDARVRVPSMVDGLDIQARRRLAGRFKRGSFNVNLALARQGGETNLSLNRDALAKLLEIAADFKDAPGVQPASLDGLLAMRGILEIGADEISDDDRESLTGDLLAGLDQAADALDKARGEEGAALKNVLSGFIDGVETLAGKARECEAARPQAIRDRLAAKITDLVAAENALTPERLDQEVALLAVKADIREELDRLAAHIESARELLESTDAVGRRLDFLAQEFNREANTLCSKSGDVALTRIGLDLKAVIDQFREQLQNVE